MKGRLSTLSATYIILASHVISYTGFNDSFKKAEKLFLLYTADLETSLHRKNLSAAEWMNRVHANIKFYGGHYFLRS